MLILDKTAGVSNQKPDIVNFNSSREYLIHKKWCQIKFSSEKFRIKTRL